jgi:hypothetical protein
MGRFLDGGGTTDVASGNAEELHLASSTKNHIVAGAIPETPLTSLVACSGKQHLALMNNNSVRRNKDMIFNGINEISKESGIHPSSLRRWDSQGFMAFELYSASHKLSSVTP